ncbi:MAG: HEPN domain-containing protein [Candidatus Brocadiia bacterium]
MSEGIDDQIEANLERAETSLGAARKLLKDDYPDFSASRAYYAAFYAATALLLSRDISRSKHSGTIAAIHQYFIKPGHLSVKHGEEIRKLFELRNVGDYGSTQHVGPQDASRAIEMAEQFVNAATELLSKT